jgi:hypothetical protein
MVGEEIIGEGIDSGEGGRRRMYGREMREGIRSE